MANLGAYFEIPVQDMDRAVAFYEAVVQITFEREIIDGNDMALFPYDDSAPGCSGALAKGDSYVSSRMGTRIYLNVGDLDSTLERALAQGGELIYPKTDTGGYGFVAEFADSEGNCIALLQR